MNKIFTKFVLVFMIIAIFILPSVSMAQTSNTNLIPCGNQRYTTDTTIGGIKHTKGEVSNPCGFKDLLVLVNRVVNFILFALAVPIAAIMFCYAGFLLITGGEESSHSRSKAKKILWGVVKGLVFAAASFLIIEVILKTLGYDGSWIGF